MTELKQKLIDALKGIDYNKLNLFELHTVADIAEKVDKLDKKDYSELLAETMKNGFCSTTQQPAKTLSELS